MGLNEQGIMQTVCKRGRLLVWRTLKSTIAWCDILLQLPDVTTLPARLQMAWEWTWVLHSWVRCTLYPVCVSSTPPLLLSLLQEHRLLTEKFEAYLCNQHGALLYIITSWTNRQTYSLSNSRNTEVPSTRGAPSQALEMLWWIKCSHLL